MSYQSLFYGALFLPTVFVLYALTKQAYRKYVLLGASWLFYFLAMRQIAWVLVATSAGVYAAALWIDRAEIPGRRTVPDFAQILRVMEDDSLSEMFYEGDELKFY